MNLLRLQLEGFQSYDEAEVAFEEGVTLINGPNGAGKSTLLRAVFGALFTSKITASMPASITLDGLVSADADEATVELEFAAGGTTYGLTWILTITDTTDDGKRSANTDTCSLVTADGDVVAAGVTEVRDHVELLLGMDADAFSKSVYVQQGQLARLVTASGDDRAKILDGLLGIDRVDEYIFRATNARPAASALRDDARSSRDALQDQLDGLADEGALERQIADLDEEIDAIETEIADRDEEIADRDEERRKTEATLEEHEERLAKRDELAEEIDELIDESEEYESEITDLESEIDDHQDEIATRETALDDLSKVVPGVDLTDRVRLPAAAVTFEDSRSHATTRVARLEGDLDHTEADADGLEAEVGDLAEQIDELEAEVGDLAEQIDELEVEIEDERAAVEDAVGHRNRAAAGLLDDVDAGAVDDDTRSAVQAHIDTLQAQRGELKAKIEGVADTVAEFESERSELESDREEIAGDVEALEERLAALDDEIADASGAVDVAENTLVSTHVAKVADALGDVEAEFRTSDPAGVTPDDLEGITGTETTAMRTAVEEARDAVREDLTAAEVEIERLELRRADFEHIAKEGECPVCEQDVRHDHELEDADADEIQSCLDAIEADYERLRRRLAELDEQRSAVETVETVAGTAVEFATTTIPQKRDAVTELERDRDDLESERDRRTGEIEEVDARLDEIETDLEATRSEATEFETDLEATQADLEEATDVVLASFDAVEEARETLAEAQSERDDLVDDVEAAEAELAETEADLEEAETDLRIRRDSAQAIAAELGYERTASDHLEGYVEVVKAAEDDHATIEERRRQITDATEAIDRHRTSIGELETEIGDLQAQVDTLDEELEANDPEVAEELLDRLAARLDTLESEVAEFEADRDERRDERERTSAKLDQRRRLAAQRDAFDDRYQWASSVYDEIDETIAAYREAKRDLRRENVVLLNRYVNDLFASLYQNKSYQRVEIDAEYGIQLVRSDGTRLTPELSSGGEGSLVAIALRAGVYRLVADRDSAGTGGLPPFILDEPTTFLDSDHVAELDSLLHEMAGWDVPQVLVVSHEDALIEAGDHELYVTKTDDDVSSVTAHRPDGSVATPGSRRETTEGDD